MSALTIAPSFIFADVIALSAIFAVVICESAKFAALSDSNTSNYILTHHPAIYLYGSLYHAANFLGGVEPARLQQWQGMYTTAMERLERNDREDQYVNAPLQQRGDVTVG